MQLGQLVAPDSACAEPTAQRVQLSADVATPYMPAPQLEHTDEPAEAYVPLGQLEQAVAPIVEPDTDPAMQTEQLDEPVSVWAVPRPQPVHDTALAPEYWPAAQLKQTAALEPEYWPETQDGHSLLPSNDWNVPATQLAQPTAPAEAEMVPAAQAPVVAVSPEVAQYEPAGHNKHEVWPAAPW